MNGITNMNGSANELKSDALDPEQIELLLSLDDGDGGVLAEIVGEFLTTGDEVRAQLLQALGDGDLPAARRAAHTLKGASSNVGAARLAEVCAAVEARAAAAELEEAVGLTRPFEAEYARALNALRALTPGG